MENISLDGWTLFSDRRNSKSYVSEDKKWLLKLNSADVVSTVEQFEYEVGISKKVYSLGLPTPQAKSVVKLEDGTIGSIYEYMPEKISVARGIFNEPEKTDYYMQKYAAVCKQLHATDCKTDMFPSAEEILRNNITRLDYHTPEQKEIMFKVIDNTPRMTKCLQGDFHPGNVIVSNDKAYLIDLSSFGYGNPLYDVGTYFCFVYYFPDMIEQSVLKVDRSTAIKDWKLFLKYYAGLESESDIAAFEKKLAPYAFLGIERLFDSIDGGPIWRQVVAEHFDEAFAAFK